MEFAVLMCLQLPCWTQLDLAARLGPVIDTRLSDLMQVKPAITEGNVPESHIAAPAMCMLKRVGLAVGHIHMAIGVDHYESRAAGKVSHGHIRSIS